MDYVHRKRFSKIMFNNILFFSSAQQSEEKESVESGALSDRVYWYRRVGIIFILQSEQIPDPANGGYRGDANSDFLRQR